MGGSSPLSRTGPECMPHRLVYYQSPSHMDCGASASSRSSYFLYSMTSLWKRGLFFMRAKSCFKPRRPDRTSVVNRLDALHTNNEGADGIHQLVYGVSFETWTYSCLSGSLCTFRITYSIINDVLPGLRARYQAFQIGRPALTIPRQCLP